jgi:hypothetical protein
MMPASLCGRTPSLAGQSAIQRMLLATLMIGLIAGCAEREGLERAVVSGAVSYQGKPAKLGYVRFVPLAGTDAPACNADIVDGKYAVTGRGGVPVGKYKVEVVAYRLVQGAPAGHQMTPGLPGGDPLAEQYIPEKYNAKTTLETTIPPGSGRITKDFDLKD